MERCDVVGASCFTEPHYDGFPAVLVRLKAVRVADLETLITNAWRSQAPTDLTTRKRRVSGKPAD